MVKFAVDAGGADNFLFGTEESHGFMAGNYNRDKDGGREASDLSRCEARLSARPSDRAAPPMMTEPTTLLTDYALSGLTAWLALRLRQAARVTKQRSVRICALAFAATAFGGLGNFLDDDGLVAVDGEWTPAQLRVYRAVQEAQATGIVLRDLVTGELVKEVENPGFIDWVADALVSRLDSLRRIDHQECPLTCSETA